MNLNQTQLQTIKTWIQTNNNSFFDESSVTLLNAIADPDFLVYRSFVSTQEVMGNNFDWTRVDNLNVGKSRIWEWMKEAYSQDNVPGLNFVNPSCRSGINTVWVGTQADLDVRAAVYSHSFRKATVAEQLLSSGSGVVPNSVGVGPATCGVGAEGLVTIQNVFDSDSA